MDKAEILKNYTEAVSPDNAKRYVPIVKRFLQHANELDKESVEKYIRWLRHEEYADGTIDLEYRTIRRLFKLNGVKWPMKWTEAPVIQEREVFAPILAPSRIQRMVQVALSGKLDPLFAAYLALSTTYGLRRVEMARISAKEIDLRQRLLYVETAKHGRQRYHAIPDEIFPVLKDIAPRMGATTEKRLDNVFHRIEEVTGLEHIEETGWHAIRRSLTRFLIEAGANEFNTSEFLRWKRSKRDMVSRYHQGQIVGEDGIVSAGHSEKQQDAEIFKVHPFLGFWKQ